uniref:PHD-type domain-containing protein n=1 Tax=Anopheles atroparvus TaxID=41427 RepID=A0A182JEY1_ANOAO
MMEDQRDLVLRQQDWVYVHPHSQIGLKSHESNSIFLAVGDDAIACMGACRARFHVTCMALHRECIKELRRNSQLRWHCSDCTAAESAGQATPSPLHDAVVERLRSGLSTEIAASFSLLRSELLGELKSALATTVPPALLPPRAHGPSESGVHPHPSTPAWNGSLTAMTGPSTKRRLIDRSPPPANSAPLLAGTGLVTSRALLTVPPTEAKFWLYLTRIAPSVPLAEVEAFAREQLGTEDATVVRLLAKDRDPSTLSFISYKMWGEFRQLQQMLKEESELDDEIEEYYYWPLRSCVIMHCSRSTDAGGTVDITFLLEQRQTTDEATD